jgi:DNA replication protein DnaC
MIKCKDCQTKMKGDAFPLCLQCRKKRALAALTPEKVLPTEVPRVIKKNVPVIPEIDESLLGQSLFLHGLNGTGKSHMAAEIMYTEMLKATPTHFNRFCWVNAPLLLFNIRQSYNSPEQAQDERFLVEKYSSIPWLCLDDLGVEKTSEWSLTTLYLIINQRYENERTTIITSNFSLDKLADKLDGDRITSRIAGMCKTILLDGADRRINKDRREGR